jgi:tripartite-type tricarboxylate transporter receptor subunit TctC
MTPESVTARLETRLQAAQREEAKAKPGAINHATTGTGNLLGIELFKWMAGINMVNVPYKGTGQAIIALVSGEVQFFIMNPMVAIPNLKAGKLRALAVTSLTRSSALPDLPTVDESAVKGYKNITWHSVVMPVGTPQPILKKLNAELVRIVNLPDVKEFFQGQGLTAVGSTPQQLSALIKEESKEYGKLVKQIGYQPQ